MNSSLSRQSQSLTFNMNFFVRSLITTVIPTLFSLGQVQADEMEVTVIPLKRGAAIEKLKEISKAIDLPANLSASVTENQVESVTDDTSHLLYFLRVDSFSTFQFDAYSRDVRYMSFNSDDALTEEEAEAAKVAWMTETQIKTRCDELKDKLLPQAKRVYFSLTDRGGSYGSMVGDRKVVKHRGLDQSTASYVVYDGETLTSNHLVVSIERSSGKVRMLILTDVKFPGKQGSQLKDEFYDPVQENIWQMYDNWFVMGRFAIKGLNADDLRPFGSQEYLDYYSSYKLLSDECVVISNGANLNSKLSLYVRPKVRDANPLIFADYFPKFLIDTKREGDTITLSGQLPDKGKTAVLTLGSKEATVDGQPLALSGAPQEIDGRLYLPYELLHECNGVLVRWDAKKNTLWVDTRYLRRP